MDNFDRASFLHFIQKLVNPVLLIFHSVVCTPELDICLSTNMITLSEYIIKAYDAWQRIDLIFVIVGSESSIFNLKVSTRWALSDQETMK